MFPESPSPVPSPVGQSGAPTIQVSVGGTPAAQPSPIQVEVVKDPLKDGHEVWADYATIGSAFLGFLGFIVAAVTVWVAVRTANRAHQQVVQDKRDLFEIETLKRLLGTLPELTDAENLPNPFITTEQFSLVAMIPAGDLPVWRDLMVQIGHATWHDGGYRPWLPVPVWTPDNADELPPLVPDYVVDEEMVFLWHRYGFPVLARPVEIVYWLLRRDIFRALATRTKRDPSDVDAWLERLAGTLIPPQTRLRDSGSLTRLGNEKVNYFWKGEASFDNVRLVAAMRIQETRGE